MPRGKKRRGRGVRLKYATAAVGLAVPHPRDTLRLRGD
jgi:hypothetical protein